MPAEVCAMHYRGADRSLSHDRPPIRGAELATLCSELAAKKYGSSTDALRPPGIDGDTARWPQLAKNLHSPRLLCRRRVAGCRKIRAKRAIEGVMKCSKPTPWLLTVSTQYPVLRMPCGIRNTKRQTKSGNRQATPNTPMPKTREEKTRLADKGLLIHEWSAEDVGADKGRIGFAGSPTKVKKHERCSHRHRQQENRAHGKGRQRSHA